MKNIGIKFLAILLIFTSCTKSGLEEINTPTVFQWPAGTSDYAPYTNSSTFVFETSNGLPAVVDSFIYTVVTDTIINSATYRKLVSNKPTLGPTYYVNYNAGVVTEIAYNFSLQGFNLPVVTQTVLKDNVAVNNTWNESQNISLMGFTFPITFTYTLLQKDFTKTVLGVAYANSISIKQELGIPPALATIAGIPAITQIDNFYAKGVGRIERGVVSTNNFTRIKRYNVVR